MLATVNNHNGSFAAVDGEGTLYWKRYELDHQDTADTSGNYTKDWYLKQVTNIDQPTTSTDTILAANALNYHTWRTETTSCCSVWVSCGIMAKKPGGLVPAAGNKNRP